VSLSFYASILSSPKILTFMSIAIFILTALVAIVSLLLILLVLMQRPKQEGLGAAFGAGITDQVWGAQTTNVLQKFTTRLTIIFFGLCAALCILGARHNNANSSSLKDEKAAPAAALENTSTPAAPATPTPGSTPAIPVTPTTGNATPSQPTVVPAVATEPTPAVTTPAPETPAAPAPTTPADDKAPAPPVTPAAPVEAPK
jgi:preprotein translocase subunit SecG